MDFQKAVTDEVLKHPSKVERMQRRHFPDSGMRDYPLRGSRRQSQSLILAERIKLRTKRALEVGHNCLWQQVHHPQVQESLVVRFNPLIKSRCPPMLACPPSVDFGNPRPGLLADSYKTEHLMQRSIAAVVLATLNGNGCRNAHQPRVAKTKHVRSLNDQH